MHILRKREVMNEVDPIENQADLTLIYNFLKKHDHIRESHLLMIGCNVALRIGDLLQLRFDQFDSNKTKLVEQKTGKNKTLTFNNTVFAHVNALREHYKTKGIDPVYLFQSTARNVKGITPVSASWVNRKFTEAQEAANLDYNLGTHSMRKTFSYNLYKRGVDIREIQKLLNHRSAATTLAYIGITRRKQEQLYIDNEMSVAI